jgi:ribosomal protein S18 acetylase RimI-like enzyme
MITVERITKPQSPQDIEQIHKMYAANDWIDAGDGDISLLVEMIVSRTHCFAVARENGIIIGMGRGISDSVSDAYIQDVTVLPEYRKQGIGGQIVKFLVDTMQAEGIHWIGLISVPGQQDFYKSLGFKEMEGYTPFKYEPDSK